jgi:hypothetical protein
MGLPGSGRIRLLGQFRTSANNGGIITLLYKLTGTGKLTNQLKQCPLCSPRCHFAIGNCQGHPPAVGSAKNVDMLPFGNQHFICAVHSICQAGLSA